MDFQSLRKTIEISDFERENDMSEELNEKQSKALSRCKSFWQKIPVEIDGRTIKALMRRRVIDHRYPTGMIISCPLNWGEWRLRP